MNESATVPGKPVDPAPAATLGSTIVGCPVGGVDAAFAVPAAVLAPQFAAQLTNGTAFRVVHEVTWSWARRKCPNLSNPLTEPSVL